MVDIAVSTNGVLSHVWVGGRVVSVDPETGELDPIKLAAAQLRNDCASDRSKIMAQFRERLGLKSFGTLAWWRQ
jgi:hypothetical protein